ncbi:hypothetical protein VJJ74_05670 [Parvimonas micra]|uniref:hypothetical protein n=1 Tax=Parvimonas micra TaxID=33033 RepID=UPI002B4AA1F5|nr:hypothetical protein [Parvimonas micra]MEB3060633.1 hypothetical protein [Parvimonas micra]MEB3066490.1 hypothetical protein [Parvimonas micra]
MSRLIDIDIFRNNIISLKHSSYDNKNNCHMTSDNMEVIDFDKVKREYLNNIGLSEECAKSVDAIIDFNGNFILIEFKNGKMKNEKKTVKEKIKDSLLIFGDIIGKTISSIRNDTKFILVYNESKNSKIEISKRVSYLAGEEIIRFDLEKYKGLYFQEIHTYTEKEFENYIKKICN